MLAGKAPSRRHSCSVPRRSNIINHSRGSNIQCVINNPDDTHHRTRNTASWTGGSTSATRLPGVSNSVRRGREEFALGETWGNNIGGNHKGENYYMRNSHRSSAGRGGRGAGAQNGAGDKKSSSPASFFSEDMLFAGQVISDECAGRRGTDPEQVVGSSSSSESSCGSHDDEAEDCAVRRGGERASFLQRGGGERERVESSPSGAPQGTSLSPRHNKRRKEAELRSMLAHWVAWALLLFGGWVGITVCCPWNSGDGPGTLIPASSGVRRGGGTNTDGEPRQRLDERAPLLIGEGRRADAVAVGGTLGSRPVSGGASRQGPLSGEEPNQHKLRPEQSGGPGEGLENNSGQRARHAGPKYEVWHENMMDSAVESQESSSAQHRDRRDRKDDTKEPSGFFLTEWLFGAPSDAGKRKLRGTETSKSPGRESTSRSGVPTPGVVDKIGPPRKASKCPCVSDRVLVLIFVGVICFAVLAGCGWGIGALCM